jgi:hypothetical protein
MRATPPDMQLGSKIEVKDSPLGGKGVFATSTIEPQEVITEYGGGPIWTEKEEEEYGRGDSKYVFRLGPFGVRVRGTSKRMRRYVEWDGARDLDRTVLRRCGHLVNTSHPLSPAPNDYLNCVFGVFAERFELSSASLPDVSLYIVCARRIEAGQELLVDYHYMLAYEIGYHCRSDKCTLCMHGLVHYVDEYVRPFLARLSARKRNSIR